VLGLVYVFMGLCGLAIGVTGYYLLALTPAEGAMLAILATLAAVVVHEHRLRRRSEKRLEKGIEELGRLLSTDAQAGQVLSQRVNALANLDLGSRLEIMEADMSVLGTVVRQVAEAVSELESDRATAPSSKRSSSPDKDPVIRHMPAVPLQTVRLALDEGRLLHHVQPIVTLPQRKVHAYELVLRLMLGKGNIVDPPEYMPVRNAEGDIVIRRIERVLADEAVKVVRRGRLGGSPVRLLTRLSLATLSDKAAIDQLIAVLAANRAVNPDLCFLLDQVEFSDMDRLETDMLNRLAQQGVAIGLSNCHSLRLDFAGLANRGVRYISVDAGDFLQNPTRYSDFHASDISDYVARFGINLMMTGIESEQQVLALLDDGMKLAQGDIIAPLGPLRQDLRDDDDDDDLRRVASN
jgi:cyclic-di-GMP phosphodiesterase, flagellum assembly factor TipF